jgi:concanavalin A-like lectin/glucanase superfamily protein
LVLSCGDGNACGGFENHETLINGALVATVSSNTFVDYNLTTMAPVIGSSDTGNWQYFYGLIDNPFVYDRALSDTELQQLATDGVPEPGTGLLVMGGRTVLGLVARKKSTCRNS